MFIGTRSTTDEGTVRVFDCLAGQVLPSPAVEPTDGAPDDLFGVALDTDGVRLIVGAPGAALPAPGAGAAYVFRRERGVWVQQARLAPTVPVPGAGFGREVAIAGNLALVGAPRDDEAANDAGAVYVFRYDGSSWTQTGKVFATTPEAGARFGTAIALFGSTAIVGAPHSDLAGADAGAVHVFESTSSSLLPQTVLVAPVAVDSAEFGTSVALLENTAFVGAPEADAAYVFTRTGSTWDVGAALTPDAGTPHFDFGASLAATQGMVLVGAPDESTLSTSGTALLFANIGSDWVHVYTLETEPVVGGLSSAGCEVAMSDGLLVASAFALESGTDATFVIANPRGADCDGNEIADTCELASDPTIDCDRDGRPDACGLRSDCNQNERPDSCDTRLAVTLVDESFESGVPPGWTLSGLWHVATPCGPGSACDGGQVAYFGVSSTCSFEVGASTSAALTLPLITIPADSASTHLRYCSTYDGECGSSVAGFDLARVVVSGVILDEVSQSCSVQGERVVDLSAFAGETVSLQFVFDSVDATQNSFFGWQIDSVRVVASLPDPTLDENANEIPDDCEKRFVRADCNTDGQVNVADPIYTIMVLFQNFPISCSSACDANADTQLDVADVMFQMASLFAGAGPPAAPFPECGLEPTFLAPLGCATFPPCP